MTSKNQAETGTITRKKIETRVIDFINFAVNAEKYLGNCKPSLLSKSITRTLKTNKNVIEDYNSDIADLNAQHAAKDDKNHLLINANTDKYEITQASQVLLNAAVKALNSKSISIDCFVSSEAPLNLGESWRYIFTPFVLEDEFNDASN